MFWLTDLRLLGKRAIPAAVMCLVCADIVVSARDKRVALAENTQRIADVGGARAVPSLQMNVALLDTVRAA